MSEHEKLLAVLHAAVNLACSPEWEPQSNEELAFEDTLRACGYIAPPDHFVDANKKVDQLTEQEN